MARAGLFGAVVAAISGPVSSAEWSVQPLVRVAAGRDSNPTLTTGSHESTTVTTVTPLMHVRGQTELSGIDVGLALNYNNYSSSQVEDTDQQILTLESSTRTSERTTLGLSGELRRDDLRQTVDVSSDAGNVGDADVGLVQTKVRRKWNNLRPSWTRALSERSNLELAYNATDVSFDNAAGTGLVDYTDQLVSMTYSYNISSRDSLNITTNASRFRAPDADNTSDTARLLVGFARAFSETSRGSISVGASRTKEDAAGSTDRSSGFVLQAGATQRSEITTLDVTVSHDVSPSGAGQSIASDQLWANWVRRVSPRINFVLRATLVRNEVLQGSDPTVDRRYYEVEPALEYQWMPRVFLRASYLYRYQKFDADPMSATGNTVLVGLAYNWRRQSLER